MSNDPWKHRSAGMQCRTCMWSVMKEPSGVTARPAIGRCRRHAPTMNGYPVVYESDWCGDHKLDENKILPTVEESKEAFIKSMSLVCKPWRTR